MVENTSSAFQQLFSKIQSANEQLSQTSAEIAQIENRIQDVDEIDGKSVFVGNVDFSASTEELRDFFSECGNIERVTIPTDKRTRSPKGFAYIEFGEKTGAIKALQFNDRVFKGRNLKVLQKRTNIPGLKRAARGRGRKGRFMRPRMYPYPYRPY